MEKDLIKVRYDVEEDQRTKHEEHEVEMILGKITTKLVGLHDLKIIVFTVVELKDQKECRGSDNGKLKVFFSLFTYTYRSLLDLNIFKFDTYT